MIRSAKLSFVLIVAALLVGCASTESTYTPPASSGLQTERTLDSNFEDVWDRYVANLSKSFFVINNISKESRIINISFSTNEPGEFVDCGKTTRVTTHPAIGEQTFHYDTANDSSYLLGVKGTNNLWRVNRATRLTGRANIYIAPQNQGTLIRANAKYVWTVNVSGTLNVGGSFSNNTTLDFSSQQEGTKTATLSEGKSEKLICRSRGTLERRLLNLIAN